MTPAGRDWQRAMSPTDPRRAFRCSVRPTRSLGRTGRLRGSPEFLADHAVCEQQAALFALNLVAHYPDDAELVDPHDPLAAEEVTHLRRVVRLLHRRGLATGPRDGAQPLRQALHASSGATARPRSRSTVCWSAP